MDLLILILAIVAVVGVALHLILWATVPTYRRPLLLHLACLCGFVSLLLYLTAR